MGARKHEDEPEWLGQLFDEVRDLRESINRMEQSLFTADPPKEVKEKGLRPRARGHAEMALRARIGRAAKHEGLTIDAWIAKYGCIEPPRRHPKR